MDRVFLASYNDIDQWGKRSDSVIKTIEESDVIFLVKNSKELNVAKLNLIDNMKKCSQLKLVDEEKSNVALIGKKMLKNYLEKCKEKPTVYIIGPSMQCVYHDSKDLKPLATEIFYHHSFQVKKLKIEKKSDDNQMDMMNLLLGESFNQQEGTVSKSSQTLRSTEKKSTIKKDSKSYFSENNKESVEKQIFDNGIIKKEYHEPHSAIQNAKARLANELQLRIQNHIKNLLFAQADTTVLTESQLLTFILLMLKTESAEIFNESWNAAENDPVMNLKEDIYKKIKGEIVYYNRMVTYMYEEDQWEV